MQLSLEHGWPKLVSSLAPSCSDDQLLFGEGGMLELLVRRAAVLNDESYAPDGKVVPLFKTHDCSASLPDIPPHYETLLNGITEDVGSDGEGRH